MRRFAAFAILLLGSCYDRVCPTGTVERNGECMPGDEIPVVDAAVEIDAEELVGCAAELPCPAPTGSRATICGRLWDTETDLPIAPAGVGAQCNTPTTDGPCSLRVRFFDALDFAMDPTGAMPIVPPDGVYTDECGRYRGHDMQRATFGFMGVAVDDAPGSTPTTPHRLTAVATPNANAVPASGFRAYATRVSTDQAWSGVLGGGATFAQRGVAVSIFQYRGTPRAGVQVRRNDGTALGPPDAFYFTDTGITRTIVSAIQTATGANGTALFMSPTPVGHDAVGGEPTGCVWPTQLIGSAQGVIFIQIKGAETPSGAPCP